MSEDGSPLPVSWSADMASFTTRAVLSWTCFLPIPGLAAAFRGKAISPYAQRTSLPYAHYLDVLILFHLVHLAFLILCEQAGFSCLIKKIVNVSY